MTDETRGPAYPAGDGPRDPDRTTGPDQAGKAAGPTAGRAAKNDDAALGLGGTDATRLPTDLHAQGEEDALSEAGGTGLERGNASLGSSSNAALPVDTFNVPGRDDPDRR
jgi:hypothetical protein